MATIKAYTDIEQSRKLAEILPLESADMYWDLLSKDKYAKVNNIGTCLGRTCVYAWSLSALLDVLPMITKDKDTANPFIAKTPDNEYYVVYATFTKEVDSSGIYDNPIDACYDMIINLNKLNLL